ncbi:TonB-dependent receptor [Dyadobacter jiangsuensis]|uniref:Carboxypeptidase-like protein n=1 Tax=Dyadobacter jiangsuensis TaxID=1591085 RepID=A0A2P8FQ39_9BACT|nr:TonB-dependent receptor [Dyadobacter jiangsuensis]PSL23819.1 carboxypeptidase-like protein [Dyadobacter jiangsuensis]
MFDSGFHRTSSALSGARLLYGCLWLLLLFLYAPCHAQEWQIAGTVYDENSQRLPSVAVYINNTSIGTTTDKAGNFHLTVPARHRKAELVASFVGYKPEVKQLQATPGRTANVVFKLDLNNVIKEVVITGKRDRHWNRKWKIFLNGLLGDAPFARQCKIVNPESITLGLDEASGRVTAASSEPVVIENSALGYRIRFHMSKFESNGKKTFLSGYKFFESWLAEDPDKQKKQLRNREIAFKDSFRNFLVLLSRKDLEAGGIEMFVMKTTREFYLTKIPLEREVTSGNFMPVTADSICFFDPNKGHYVLHSKYPVLVFQRRLFNSASVFSDYPFKYSQIVLPNFACTFTENGWLVSPNGITIHDTWAREGFADMLPIDYPLPKDQSEPRQMSVALLQNAGQAKEPPNTDLKLPAIEAQQTLLDKEGLIQPVDKAGDGLIKPDYVLPVSESDNSGTVFDLLKRIPGLRVTFDAASNTYKVHFIENNTNLNASTSFDNTVALLLDRVFYSGADSVIPILNSLTVRDIKSVSAVRYGSAAAFGARGGNGVLVINTHP